ncbi:cold shock domain-containing protein [Vibrio astriarenae]|uniref:Cold shock domain-containing protein n=1 Tax=Vibrio astriarenae TaxID=1481923 RepID=A0A7Z2YFU9_9VIBR|nr:cold shock domain-containing protein [Vibrio astriarenae]QIA65569.1 cold shock domain-containing protein [Vibrio astriarenae]
MYQLKAQVTWFNQQKGFGFAAPDIVAIDVLIDVSSLDTPDLQLYAGDRVYVEVSKDHDGRFQAHRVILL